MSDSPAMARWNHSQARRKARKKRKPAEGDRSDCRHFASCAQCKEGCPGKFADGFCVLNQRCAVPSDCATCIEGPGMTDAYRPKDVAAKFDGCQREIF